MTPRLPEPYRRLPELLHLPVTDDEPCNNQPICKPALEASYIAEDSALCKAANELRRRSLVLDQLRKAMHTAPVDGGNGLNDDATAETLSTIRQGVEKFRRELEGDPKPATGPLSLKMAGQIDQCRDKLFVDSIKVDAPNEPVTIHLQRNNNIPEQFFRGVRRAYRRKTGTGPMCRALQAMPADIPLVRNLDNPDYMNILLDGKANLEALFAELGATHLAGSVDCRQYLIAYSRDFEPSSTWQPYPTK